LTRFDYLILGDLRRAIARRSHGILGRVLDYGCGGKPYEPLFKHCDRYEGADFPGNLSAAWPLDEKGRLPEQLAASFDAVVSFQVLEHAPDAAAYLGECRRVLRSNGHLLLTTHGIWEYHPGPYDVQRWTMEGLIRMMEANDFETMHTEAITTRLRSLLQQLQILVYRGRVPGRTFLTVFLNLLGLMCTRSAPTKDDRHSLAICYLYFGRRKTHP
jgi:SAM-dependent methyltransferase